MMDISGKMVGVVLKTNVSVSALGVFLVHENGEQLKTGECFGRYPFILASGSSL